MEIRTKEVQTNERGKTLTNQFMMDEDFNVPDSKCDVERIVASNAKLRVEEIKPVENYVCVRGKLEFQVLYVGEGLERKLFSMEGKIPFEEMVYTDSVDGLYEVKQVRTEVSTELIYSRKLRVKAMAEMELETQKERTWEIPLDVEGSNLYKKKKNMELLFLHTKKHDTYRIKEEIILPGTKETIGTMLWTDIQNRKIDTKIETGELVLSGELLVFCFYESLDGKIDWMEQTVPYHGRVTCYGALPSMYHEVQADLDEVYTDVRMDEDGEMRIVGVEGTLKLGICIYEEEQMDILEDVYSLEKQCKLEKTEMQMETLIMQNHSKCKMTQKLSLPELKNTVLQICHSSGTIQLDRTEVTEQGVLVEGALYVSFLYVKANDEIPFDTWQGAVPFSYLIECKEVPETMRQQISSILEQMSVTLLGGDEIEVKAVLAFHCFFQGSKKLEIIKDIRLEPLVMEEMEKRPGVIGYIVKEDDNLWDLAKRYSTTQEGIMEVNELVDEQLKVGDRILIFKENLSIL